MESTANTYQSWAPTANDRNWFLRPLVETDKGNRYILVVGDHLWMPLLLLIKKLKTVAMLLVIYYLCDKGFPEQLHSDQGPQFESEIFNEMCKSIGIKSTRTSSYHPALMQCRNWMAQQNTGWQFWEVTTLIVASTIGCTIIAHSAPVLNIFLVPRPVKMFPQFV